MNRRSFLRGVAAAAVAIPLAPLLPKVAALPPSATAIAMLYDSAIYRPKYLYDRALMYDWSGPYRLFTDDEISRALDGADKWMEAVPMT